TVLQYRRDRLLVQRVRELLRQRASELTTADALSHALHVSTRTLHRQLSDEGAALQNLKDEVRRDEAIAQLCRSTKSIKQIALTGTAERAVADHRIVFDPVADRVMPALGARHRRADRLARRAGQRVGADGVRAEHRRHLEVSAEQLAQEAGVVGGRADDAAGRLRLAVREPHIAAELRAELDGQARAVECAEADDAGVLLHVAAA